MGFVGMLGDESFDSEEKKDIFQDFNLGVCITKINSLVKGYDVQAMYMEVPKKESTIRYRRHITSDLQEPSLRAAFSRYAAEIEKAKKQEKQSVYKNHFPQKGKWHADAMDTYADAVESLYNALLSYDGLLQELQSLISYLKDYISSEQYQTWRNLEKEIVELLREESLCFSIQKNKVVFEESGEYESFGKRMMRAFRIAEKKKQETQEVRELTRIERVVAERVVKQRGLDKKMKQLLDVKMDEALVQVATDVQYYLGFFRFADEMKEKGYEFCLPTEGEDMSIRGGYDAALVVKSDKPVIKNDFTMGKKEKFFVITGANGGGKTTFARMVGQILYFCRMGLLVPCDEATIPPFTDVLSHFSNEETEASGRGKLVEELTRLQPMMQGENQNCFVILNELFTTAATYDAGIMGQNVLTHFMEMNCRGIYVTHIQSLAEEREGVVSLVAELESDHHTRSFKIVRKPANEGEYEDSLITKYNMTYEQMKAVMEHAN